MAQQKTYSIKIDGIEQSVKGVENLGNAVNSNATTIKDLRTALKATKDEMAGLDKNTKQWQDLAKVAGDYKDRIDDINQATSRFASDTKMLDDAINIGKSMTSVFTLAKGAMSAFGLETEGAVEAIQKLQGAMAIIQSLQSLQETLRGSTAVTDAFTKAQALLTKAMGTGSIAAKTLRGALLSIPLMLIIGLVTELVMHWEDVVKWFKNTFPIIDTLSKKFNGFKGIIKGVGEAIVHWLTNPIVTLGKALKKLFKGDFSGALEEIKSGFIKQFTGVKDAFLKGVEDSKKSVEEASEKTGKKVVKDAKNTAKEVKDITKKMLDDLAKMQRKAENDIQKMRDEALKKEKERLEKLNKLRKDNTKAENDYQKQKLKLDLANAKTDEEKLKIQKEIIKLDEKIATEEKKIAAADAMGISVDELNKRLTNTEATYVGLNDEQKQVLQTLITQVATIKMGAEEAMAALGGGSTTGSTGDSSDTQNPLAKFFDNDIVQNFVNLTLDSIEVIGEAIASLYDMELEEMEEKLDEISELHDDALSKVNDSQDRIAELNDKMKEASGGQLEQYKQQMADEMLLLQQRQQEERRLQKEKEKQEADIKKKQKEARKAEMKVQLIESIVNTALAVTKTFSAYPMPWAAIMGGIISTLGAIQQGIIIKQMSKLASGGVLGGREHKDGGNPIPSMGVEVEKGEAVINKRSTAKYLPLLDAINAEGNGGKHTLLQSSGNVIRRYADGGVLNYQRIDDNFNQLNGTAAIARSIEAIDFHPYVAITDINRGQKNMVEIRELAGANS